MSQRRWKLVVTELGAAAPLHDVTVEAGDWMTALARARAKIGERGGIPPGASCAVAPDGKVTILDGVARRQYAVAPTTDPVSVPPPAPPAQAAAPAKGKVSKATVAYMPSPLAGGAPAVAAVGASVSTAARVQPGPPSPSTAAPAVPPSQPPPGSATPASQSVPPSAAASAKPGPKHTVAYVPPSAPAAQPAPGAPPQPAAAPAPVPPASQPAPAPLPETPAQSAVAAPTPAKGSKVSHQTVAYLPGAAAPPRPSATAAPAEVAPLATPVAAAPVNAAPPVNAPAPAPASAPPPPPLADGAELLYARDGEPSKESPLVYRERTFVVAPGTSADDAEMIVRRRFAALRAELEGRPKGKLVNMAVFDHRWEDRPVRPPLVALQWKDWKGEPEIQRPPQPAAAPPPAPVQPPVAAAPAAPQPRQRLSTPGPDERLTTAFEALQDLFFLGSPLEGAEFVLNLLGDLVPHEAGSVCLYDINSDELRFVALRGPGAEERKGEAVPLRIGLIGAAAADFARPMLVEDVSRDGRFDPGVDGRVGVDPQTMALQPVVHGGRLQAVVQLINRQGQAQFSKGDANLLAYVGEKLGEFLHQARLSEPSKKPATPKGMRPR